MAARFRSWLTVGAIALGCGGKSTDVYESSSAGEGGSTSVVRAAGRSGVAGSTMSASTGGAPGRGGRPTQGRGGSIQSGGSMSVSSPGTGGGGETATGGGGGRGGGEANGGARAASGAGGRGTSGGGFAGVGVSGSGGVVAGASNAGGRAGASGGVPSGGTGDGLGNGGDEWPGGFAGALVVQPASGAVSITLSAPSKAYADTRSCNAGTVGFFTYAIGQAAQDQTIESGTQGVEVSCVVAADGTFSATITGDDENGHKPVAYSFSGRIIDQNDATMNTGSMTALSPDTGPQTSRLTGAPLCTFGPVSKLQKGAILTDLTCPLIGSVDDNSSGCSVYGTIAFEDCKTSGTLD